LHEKTVHVDHELWWDFMVLELLEYDTSDHEILDVVRTNDEASWRYFLHRSGDGSQFTSRRVIGRLLTFWSLTPDFLRFNHGTLEREATKPGCTGNLLALC
jgi:hypothetical protein